MKLSAACFRHRDGIYYAYAEIGKPFQLYFSMGKKRTGLARAMPSHIHWGNYATYEQAYDAMMSFDQAKRDDGSYCDFLLTIVDKSHPHDLQVSLFQHPNVGAKHPVRTQSYPDHHKTPTSKVMK